MELAEFFVAYLQPYLPTPVVRVLVRWYLYLFVGWRMRSGDVVVQPISYSGNERGNSRCAQWDKRLHILMA